jgi:hypothetical protein
MGMVRMESELGKFRYSDGYHDCKITYYIYCDKCGSFSIKEFRSLKSVAKIAIGLSLGVLGVASLWYMRDSSSLIVGSVGCFLAAFLAFDLFITLAIFPSEKEHRCRHCGNTEITDKNILNYPVEDASKIDVPEWLTHKHYDYIYA